MQRHYFEGDLKLKQKCPGEKILPLSGLSSQITITGSRTLYKPAALYGLAGAV